MHTTTDTDPIDELEITEGWLDGRHVWFVSDGRVLPFIAGGDGTDDDDDGDDDQDDDSGDGDDDQDDDGDEDDVEELRAQVERWKRSSRKHEQRAKENKKQLDKLRRGKGSSSTSGGQKRKPNSDSDGGDLDVDAIRDEAFGEARKEFAERSVEVFLDAQVEAGRLSDDQAEVLLDSIDPTKFIDDDGDVDTAKVKALIEGIAKPATGDGKDPKKKFPDTGQGRRNGGQRRREKSSSVSAGRELFAERHGKSNQTN